MTTGLEIAAAAALKAALTKVAVSTAVRIGAAVDPRPRRDRRKAEAVEQLLANLDFGQHLSLLGVLTELPHGVTLAQVERALGSLEVLSVLHEAVAVGLTAAPPARADTVRRNFALVLSQQIASADPFAIGVVADRLFDLVAESINVAIDELRIVSPDAFARLQAIASTSLVNSTLDAIVRHGYALEASADRSHREVRDKWEADYRSQVVANHGHIVPPDFEQKRKVPMRSLYVAPRIRPELQTNFDDADSSIDEFRTQIDRAVLLGDPGGGKSTASDYIASQTASESAQRTPFVVVLRDFARDDVIEKSIVDHIADRCGSLYQCTAPVDAVESILLSGRGLVIFDGLDELIDSTKRREVTQRVELFASRYPMCAILVTSRRVGYDQARLDPQMFRTFGLSGFQEGDVSAYVQKWFAYVEEMSGEDLQETSDSFLEECATVPDLTATPLMLSLMCIIYRGQGFIPRNRPAVYEHCARLLFEKWDSSRKIYVELRAAAQVDNAVKHLAYWMLTNQSGVEAVSEAELVAEASEYLRISFEEDAERRAAAEEFVEFCRGRAWVLSEAGTTATGEALFKFTHRTFMEYFAAYELTRRNDGPEAVAKVLLPRIAAQEWDVVGQLAVQISDKHSSNGAERIFVAMLGDRRRRSAAKRDNVLAFIWRCLGFVAASSAVLRRLAQESTRSSFDVRRQSGPRFDLETSPSIFQSLGVLPESQALVSEAVGQALLETIASQDPDRSLYGKMLALSWGDGFNVTNSKETDAFWWAWSVRFVEEHRSDIFDGGQGDRDAWMVAMVRGLVSFSDYLAASASWGEDRLLNLLFTPQSASPLGFLYLDWGSAVLNRVTWVDQPLSIDESTTPRIQVLIEQLSDFGDHFDASTPTPWATVEPTFLGFGDRSLDFAWSPVGVDNLHWGVWVILVAALEALERAIGRAARAAHSHRVDRDAMNGFIAKLLDMRRGALEAVPEVFAGTMFESFDGARAGMRDAWLRGEVSVSRFQDAGLSEDRAG